MSEVMYICNLSYFEKGGDYPIGVERENRERKKWIGTELTAIILDIAQGF